MQAIEHSRTEVVKLLLECNAEINGFGMVHRTLTQIAIMGARQEIIQMLVEAGASLPVAKVEKSHAFQNPEPRTQNLETIAFLFNRAMISISLFARVASLVQFSISIPGP